MNIFSLFRSRELTDEQKRELIARIRKDTYPGKITPVSKEEFEYMQTDEFKLISSSWQDDQ